RFLPHHLRVLGDVGRRGHAVDEPAEVGHSPYLFQESPVTGETAHRHEVDRLVLLVEVEDQLTDDPVVFPVKIPRIDDIDDLVQRLGVDEDTAEYRLFRI